MSQGKRNYHTIASGWLKEGQKGQYISASVDKKVKLNVELEDGTQVPLTSFAVFFSEEKKNEKAPDVRFVFSTED